MAALLFALALLAPSTSGPGAGAQVPGDRFYPETGKTLAREFVAYYDARGGLPVFGYPITEARMEGGYLVQWTERERLEWHPENRGTDYEVLLGLLGRELTKGLDGPRFARTEASAPSPSSPGARYFPETGQSVAQPFLRYWQERGGLAMYGYPISTLFQDERGFQVQWFERARFELHPELPEEFRVSLGLLGRDALARQDVPSYELEVSGNVASGTGLQLGLAQGGESEDPAFLDNVRQAGSRLGPGMVRIDNIYTHYRVVQRGADGVVRYDWTNLDRLIDGIRAMGKEPFICLSYMPEAISVSGTSRVQPPANYDEWAALVKATVTHLNGERKLGIRYWEVWNEPNLWDFWKASFDEYLKLYDVTVEAALAADPTIKIGGPAFSRFERSGIEQFMAHQADRGERGRVNFLSWHAYGQSPAELSNQVRQAREITARYPQFNPELMITEFNVLQGGAGDTSANGFTDRVEGAIGLLRSIEGMSWERLDRAFLFELKDGKGDRQYWGRWGILTNDGQPKPVYHALRAYANRPEGMLPVTVKSGPTDGTLGLMAFGGGGRATLMLWYTGPDPARVKITLPRELAAYKYRVTPFDQQQNNPAITGDATLKLAPDLHGGDLLLNLRPTSLVILEAGPRE